MKNQIKLLMSELKKYDTDRIIDIATGKGEFISFLSRGLGNFQVITGIDQSKKILEIARKMNKDERVNFTKMNAYHLEFDDEYFDLACISNSLHHFKNPELILLEMMRVIKKNGFIFINEMYCDGIQSKAQQNHIRIHHWSAKINRLRNQYHDETYPKAYLVSLIKKLKLTKLKLFDYFYPVIDPMDARIINSLQNILAPFLAKIKNDPEYDQLKQDSDDIRKSLLQYGFAPASSIFIIGEK